MVGRDILVPAAASSWRVKSEVYRGKLTEIDDLNYLSTQNYLSSMSIVDCSQSWCLHLVGQRLNLIKLFISYTLIRLLVIVVDKLLTMVDDQ